MPIRLEFHVSPPVSTGRPVAQYSRGETPMRAVLSLLVLLALTPATASAVSIQEIVALSNSGVSDEVILTLIERDNTIFTIEPEQLVALKRQGVSQAVVLAMLRSGRQPAAPTQTADAAAALPHGVVPFAPETVIVGHGPDRPNTYHQFDYPFDYLAVAAAVPYLVYVPTQSFCLLALSRVSSATLRAGRFMNDPTQRFLNDPTQRFINNGFLAEPQTANDSARADCVQPWNVPARAERHGWRR